MKLGKTVIFALILLTLSIIGVFLIPELINPFSGNHTDYAIVFGIRLPAVLTAIFCGSSLSISGLILQQLFRNNLAGPYILGVSSGASLAVGTLIIASGFLQLNYISLSIPIAGFIGAFVILILILLVSARFGYGAVILLFGVIIGQLSGALQSLLSYFAQPGDLKLFTLWSLGSFSNVIGYDLINLIVFSIAGLIWALFLMPSLSVMLLGNDVARSLGVNTNSISMQLLACTGLLTGLATAYCGPIAFIGMAVPNVSRIIVKTANFKLLLITNALLGAIMAVLSQIISDLDILSVNIPVNVTTALIGGPIIIHILLKNRN